MRVKSKSRRKLKKEFKILLSIIIIGSIFMFIKSTDGEEISSVAKKLNSKEEYIIDDIETFNQMPLYPTGCESVSLYILLKHYNVDVSIDAIIEALPKGELPYEENGEYYGSNPETEFVGSPYNNYSYGVFEGPLGEVANIFKKGAISSKKFTINNLKKKIKEGIPVITWIRIQEDMSPIEYAEPWISSQDGKIVKWIKGEHAVVLYGYDSKYYYISNPYNGEKYGVEKNIFEYNYELMGQRVLYYED